MRREPPNKIKIERESLEMLYNIEHLSPEEIGVIFGCSDVTIRTKLIENKIKFKTYYRECKYCSKSFKISKKSRCGKFCSKKCGCKEYYFRVISPVKTKGISQKICKFCKKEFTTSFHQPNQIYCSSRCSHKFMSINNKERFTKYYKEHYEKNKEKIKARSKKWREDNYEKYIENGRIYCKKNRIKAAQRAREWHDEFNIRENKRRKEMNLPLVGEGYMTEMELLYYIRKLFKNEEIMVHSRRTLSKWNLGALELDIYLPNLKLAFEYMGRQHYDKKYFISLCKANRIPEEFDYQQYKDRCKKKLCKMKGITLIRVKYDEKLSEQLVLSKLKYANFETNQKVLYNSIMEVNL